MNMKWLKLLGISVLLLVMQSACKKDLLPNGFYSVEDIIIYPNGNIDTVKYKARGGEFKKNPRLTFVSDSSQALYTNIFDFQSNTSLTFLNEFSGKIYFNVNSFQKSQSELVVERQEKSGAYLSTITYKYIE